MLIRTLPNFPKYFYLLFHATLYTLKCFLFIFVSSFLKKLNSNFYVNLFKLRFSSSGFFLKMCPLLKEMGGGIGTSLSERMNSNSNNVINITLLYVIESLLKGLLSGAQDLSIIYHVIIPFLILLSRVWVTKEIELLLLLTLTPS